MWNGTGKCPKECDHYINMAKVTVKLEDDLDDLLEFPRYGIQM